MAIPSLDPSLHDILDRLEHMGRQAGLTFVLDSGTLLGVLREGRLLPNDPDLDVSVTDAAGFDRLIAGQPGIRVWHFARRPYKAELPLVGTDVVLDVKLFRRAGDCWVSPAIGTAMPSNAPSTPWRRLVRPAWRWALAHGDAARFPLRQLARVDAWSVPVTSLIETQALGGREHCRVPADGKVYLAYRYGANWRTPQRDWVSRRDDGGYRHDAGDLLRGSIEA